MNCVVRLVSSDDVQVQTAHAVDEEDELELDELELEEERADEELDDELDDEELLPEVQFSTIWIVRAAAS